MQLGDLSLKGQRAGNLQRTTTTSKPTQTQTQGIFSLSGGVGKMSFSSKAEHKEARSRDILVVLWLDFELS